MKLNKYNLFSGIIPVKLMKYVMGLNKIKFLLLMCSVFFMMTFTTSLLIELVITEIDISIPFLEGATLGKIFFYGVVIAPFDRNFDFPIYDLGFPALDITWKEYL